MLVHFFLLVCLFGANIKNLYQEVKKIDKKIWLILLLIFIAGFYLRNAEYWLGPHTDGYVAQESAHLWLLYGEFVKACALGNHINCQLFEQVLAPPGFPLLIALAHLIFGIHSLNASVISAILSSLTILLVFLIAYFIFKKEVIGLYAALIFSFIPLNIINSQTGLSRPTGLFFVGLTVLFYFLAIKNNKFITWILTIVCLSYAIYVRQESYILLPFLFIFFVIFKWSIIKAFLKNLLKKRKKDFKIVFQVIISALIFLVLQIPVLHWLLVNNPYSHYPVGGFFGLHYKGFIIYGSALLQQFFDRSPISSISYNVVISIIFFMAMFFLIILWKKKYLFIVGLFLTYFFLYSFMLGGTGGQLTGDYLRRSLMFHLPYAIISGYGIYLLNPFKKRKFLLLGLFPLLMLLIFANPLILPKFISPLSRGKSFTLNYSFYFPKSLFKDARATKKGDPSIIYPSRDYWLAVAKIPNDCLVITGLHMIVTNDYFENNQRKAAQIDLIFDSTEDLFLDEFKRSDCLIYIEDYRCGPDYRDSDDYACQFLNKHLDKKFLFQEGRLKIHSVELK